MDTLGGGGFYDSLNLHVSRDPPLLRQSTESHELISDKMLGTTDRQTDILQLNLDVAGFV